MLLYFIPYLTYGIVTCIVNGDLISSIGNGLCVLIGISREDEVEDMDYMCVFEKFDRT